MSKSAIEVFLHAGIVALSKDVTDYGPRSVCPYYNLKITHREGSPYPKFVTCDRPVGLNNLKKAKGQSEAVNRRTDNAMAKRKKGRKEQTMGDKILHKKSKDRATRSLLKSGIEIRRSWNVSSVTHDFPLILWFLLPINLKTTRSTIQPFRIL